MALDSGSKKVGSRRPKQQRGVQSRTALLWAAFDEFAEFGYDAASMRRIGERAGLDYTLIKYHFGNKDGLWRAAAQLAISEILAQWETTAPESVDTSAVESLKAEFKSLLRFTVQHSAWHMFMLNESKASTPRLEWLVENVVSKSLDRIVPQIRAAQEEGYFQSLSPELVYYAMVGAVTLPSSIKGEMRISIAFDLEDERRMEEYWRVIEALFLKLK